MLAIKRRTKRYPTDLTDEKWARIAPLWPPPANRGRKLGVDLREVLNATRYMAIMCQRLERPPSPHHHRPVVPQARSASPSFPQR